MASYITAIVRKDLDVHIILDNYGTHKTAIIRKWFAKRPRFHLHYTPTYGSWINLVARWFAEITNKRIRRGIFRSVKDLEAAIRELPRCPQRESQTLRLDSDSGRDSSQHRTFRSAHTHQCATLMTYVTNHLGQEPRISR